MPVPRPFYLACLLSCSAFAEPRALLGGDLETAQPALTRIGSQVWLSWTERADPGHRLRMAHWSADGLGAASTVAEGERLFVNWADFPTLLGFGAGKASYVLDKLEGSPYAYAIRLRVQASAGDWRDAEAVHDASASEHGFASLWDWDGELGIAWLDGRDTAGAGHDHSGGGAMSLRAARYDERGRKLGEWPLDARTCDCCQTDAAMTREGPVLVYRDRSEQEIRDIALLRWQGTQWSTPIRVHADDWHMPGCPVNGPALAARDDTVWVAWYTGAQPAPRVQLARSNDGGRSFSAPTVIAQGEPVLGRVDLAVDAGGNAWVSWIDERSGEQTLRLSRVDGEGVVTEREIAAVGRGRGTGFPRMAIAEDTLWLTWTDTRAGRPQVWGERIPLQPGE